MRALRDAIVFSLGLAALLAIPSWGQQKRPITPSDCVTVRDLQHDDSTWRSTIKISPDSSRIAYPVKTPNLSTNENDIELYVRLVSEDPANPGRPLLVGDISAIRWTADSKHLTMLVKEDGRRVVERVDTETGGREMLVRADTDIAEYSIDRDGKTVVYATDFPRTDSKDSPSPEEVATGYRIPFEESGDIFVPKRRLFVTRQSQTGWTTPEPIIINSPLSQAPLPTLPYVQNAQLQPTLSPNGKALLVVYDDYSQSMPEEWRSSAFMQFRNTAGILQLFHLLVLYDLAEKKTTAPLKSPWVYSAAVWSSDSKSFMVAAKAPVSSELEKEDVKSHRLEHSSGAHLFWVKASTGTTEEVVPKLAYPWEGPLYWDMSGDVFARETDLDTISRFSRKEEGWKEVSSFRLPLQASDQLATDGKYVIGDFNDTETPPRLFVYQPGEKDAQVFAKLNPQFEQLTLARGEEVHWKTSTGFDASGKLLLPPNYAKGVRYPLVIQTKPFAESFVCSFGNFPSFSPQPLANAGILYLGSILTKNSTQREEDYYPKGYPAYQGTGGAAEAAFAMDLWDSAVRALDEQGLVDSSRVGIIGFSRTGWYTEFILAHSKVHYGAATVADNIQYSLGEYWMSRSGSSVKTFDLMYGGPPYGPTLKNWLDYSVSFNLDKIHTPLLMEQMGYGTAYKNPQTPPIGLAVSFEVFTGLNRLGKAVELYYYPNEDHTPDHPKARLATMQRNVDWYRFWLQEYERESPEDPSQYTRWRKLRELQQEDEKKAGLKPAVSRSLVEEQTKH